MTEYMELLEFVEKIADDDSGMSHEEYVQEARRLLGRTYSPEGGDLCDRCMCSGVEVAYTDSDGKTVCVECAEADHDPNNCSSCEQAKEPNVPQI